MKIRNGFVSNSSSSSFIVLLPDNFLEIIDYEKIINTNELNKFKKLLNKFIEENGIWMEDIYNYNGNSFDEILYDILEPYIVTSIDVAPDAGQFIVLDSDRVSEILDNIKK
jgi:hypothetical protein